MKNKGLMVLLLFLIPLFAYTQEPMNASEVSAFRSRISTNIKDIRSIRADFVQTKHVRILNQPVSSSGQLYFENPGKLKWQYTKPYAYSVLFKDNRLYINEKGKKEQINLQDNRNFDKLGRLLSGTMNGDIFQDRDFNIEYLKDGTVFIARFKPKNAQFKAYIQSVELYFNGNETTVSRIKMTEPNDDYTLIQFSKKQLNISIDASVFNQ